MSKTKTFISAIPFQGKAKDGINILWAYERYTKIVSVLSESQKKVVHEGKMFKTDKCILNRFLRLISQKRLKTMNLKKQMINDKTKKYG
jgi:hypothetical protein